MKEVILKIKEHFINNITYYIVLIILSTLGFVAVRNNSIVLVSSKGNRNIKIEVYDSIVFDKCLDTLSKEDSLLIINTLNEVSYKPKAIEYIAIHTTASAYGQYPSEGWWINFFYKKKYPGTNMVGYNYLISDNKVFNLRPLNNNNKIDQHELVWGVKGFNSKTVSIAYVGGLDKQMKNIDTRNDFQKRTIDSLVRKVKLLSPKVIVKGHKNFPNVSKSCPNYDVIKITKK